MDRETTEIIAGMHKFVVKTYATAREHNTIQQALFKGMKVEVVGEQPKINDFSPSAMFEMQQELVAQMVLSMDGSDKDIVGRCLDLPSGDFDVLVSALDQLSSKKKK